MDLSTFREAFGDHPELADLPDFDRARDFERRERLVAANDAWAALPVYKPERSLLLLLRIGRRLRKLLHLS